MGIITLLPRLVLWWQNRRKAELPTCYGSKPGAQAQAENGCNDCEWSDLCIRRRDRL